MQVFYSLCSYNTHTHTHTMRKKLFSFFVSINKSYDTPKTNIFLTQRNTSGRLCLYSKILVSSYVCNLSSHANVIDLKMIYTYTNTNISNTGCVVKCAQD